MKLPALKESQIQRTVCDFLRAERWRVFEFEHEFSERKRKTFGEPGMPDVLAIRYNVLLDGSLDGDPLEPWKGDIVLWIELKRIDGRGRTTKARADQKAWHGAERARGALTWIAGEDFPATIEGFIEHYRGMFA